MNLMKERLEDHFSHTTHRVGYGASSHMTQKRELLVDYEEFDKPQKVCLGGCHTVEAFGKQICTSQWS